MKSILSCATLLLALPALAQEGSTPSKDYGEHTYHFGVHVGAALPSQFNDDGLKGSLGVGWGFALGWHGFEHWDFEFRTGNSFQTVEPGIGDSEDMALESTTSLNGKFYPSKKGEISFYGLAGLGLQSLSVTEEGSFLSLNEPEEPTFYGYHWALGVGLEQKMRAPLTFWTDLSVQHQSYGSVILDEESHDLDPSASRWSVALRAGVSAGFW